MFPALSTTCEPEELVRILNDLFARFDKLASVSLYNTVSLALGRVTLGMYLLFCNVLSCTRYFKKGYKLFHSFILIKGENKWCLQVYLFNVIDI